ncbi:MAG TPA: EthD domain-containing protein [Acidimicrobiales bacterium]|nr:EthD domain-containing protein [Acidimicrobiales bacterium]
MIKLICFVRRKPGMAADEFHRYWREEHGPLVARTRSGQHALRYEQNHRVRGDDDGDGYDGVTIQWFASVDDFYASIREDDYAEIAADIEKFLDASRLEFVLTEEPDVIFDRL